jgi:magnesium-transporting ATPase (P-type)
LSANWLHRQVEIFQDYNDTVISVGLSHLTRNEAIFARADIAVGIDVLQDTCGSTPSPSTAYGQILADELDFVQSISAHSCAFRLKGASSVSHISTIIEKGRSALEAATAATIFVATGSVSFSFYVLFSVLAPFSSILIVPAIGSAVYLLVLLPCMGLAIAMSDGDENVMTRVPPKNERGVAFARSESRTFYALLLSRAVLPALLPQACHPIVLGELMLRFDQNTLSSQCPGAQTWVDVVRCDKIRDTFGSAKDSAGSVVFALFVLCTLVASAGFVHRFLPVRVQRPWDRNPLWLYSVFLGFGLLVAGIAISTREGSLAAQPLYFFLMVLISPLLCLLWGEHCKQREAKLEKRAEKLRRLQFETRLGAWSPR